MKSEDQNNKRNGILLFITPGIVQLNTRTTISTLGIILHDLFLKSWPALIDVLLEIDEYHKLFG